MNYSIFPKVQTCRDLLIDFQSKNQNFKGQKLVFSGIAGKDVYNITAPFEDNGTLVIAGRVEGRDTEYSEVVFFSGKGDVWFPKENTKTFMLQDPFFTRIGGELIFGGVEVWPYRDNPARLNWRTTFYRGKSINDLEPFATGPEGMKDIRLVELQDGRIGVFTRPQGEIGGRGQIGFTTIDTLNDLNVEVISKAELISKQFTESEWGGANELHLLKNGLIGVLGHIACYDGEGNRHYYSMVFSFNPFTRAASPMKIIATRNNFAAGPAKKPDLVDVIFSGGLVRHGDGTATLYAGVSDAEAHRVKIPDPFSGYENEAL